MSGGRGDECRERRAAPGQHLLDDRADAGDLPKVVRSLGAALGARLSEIAVLDGGAGG